MKEWFTDLWSDKTVFVRAIRSLLVFVGIWAATSPRMVEKFGAELPALIAAVGMFLKAGDQNNVSDGVAKELNRAGAKDVRDALALPEVLEEEKP